MTETALIRAPRPGAPPVAAARAAAPQLQAAPVHALGARIRVLGVWHHCPLTAECLEAWLRRVRPQAVLIEGPADFTPLLGPVAHADTKPPVAMEASLREDPERSFVGPFVTWSPEWRALLWGRRAGATTRLIDLPMSSWLAHDRDVVDWFGPWRRRELAMEIGSEDEAWRGFLQPFGAAAARDGYVTAQGEPDHAAWWAALMTAEETPEARFDRALAEAAASEALETGFKAIESTPGGRLEAARNAHMRLEIARAAEEVAGVIAVICGAAHGPHVLAAPSEEDWALVQALPHKPTRLSWTPWTEARMPHGVGEGGCVAAPSWSRRLWETRRLRGRRDFQPRRAAALWMADLARAARAEGAVLSTAALTDAAQTAQALALLRGRRVLDPTDLRDGLASAVCGGDLGAAQQLAARAGAEEIVGEVGGWEERNAIEQDFDAQRQALALNMHMKGLTMDRRRAVAREQRAFFHRLTILGVDWLVASALASAHEERVTLRWSQDFRVRVTRAAAWGATIAQAADSRLRWRIAQAPGLDALAELGAAAVAADLPQAREAACAALRERFEAGERLGSRAVAPLLRQALEQAQRARRGGSESDAAEARAQLLAALIPPLAAGLKDAFSPQGGMIESAPGQTSMAVVGLGAGLFALGQGDPAIRDALPVWRDGLAALAAEGDAPAHPRGIAARLAWDAGAYDPAALAALLREAASADPSARALSDWLRGFFFDFGETLILEKALFEVIDDWVRALEDERFVGALPAIRSVVAIFPKRVRAALVAAGEQAGEGARDGIEGDAS